MSHSPTDLGAGWTFISALDEVDQELHRVVENGDLKDGSDAKNTNSHVDKDVSGADPSEEELGDDDVTSVTSESESLPSSDVDILEQSVGPDHEYILQVSSTSHSTSFSISNPLEVMSESLNSISTNIPTDLPEETVQTNAAVRDTSPCEREAPLPGVSSTNSPRDLERLASIAQPVQSSKAPDNLPHPEPEKLLQEQGHEQQTSKRTKVPSSRQRKRQKDVDITRSCVCDLIDSIRIIASDVKLLSTYFLLWFAIVYMIFWLIPCTTDKKYLSPKTAAHLKSVQDETLKCLGLQHLTAVENNHYGMLLSNVCINDSVAWKENFEILLKDKTLKPLLNKVYHEPSIQKKTEIVEGFMSEARNNVQGIKFDLLLHQLDYLQLLHPVEEDSQLKDVHKKSPVADLISEKLEEQEQLLDQLHQLVDQLKLTNFALKSLDGDFKTADGSEEDADLVALKPVVYRLCLENAFLSNQLQLVMDQFDSGEFLAPAYWMGSFNLNDGVKNFESSKMDELMEKVNSLLTANDEFKKMYSHFNDLKPEMKGNDKEEASPAVDTENNSKASHKSSGTSIENLESLAKELLDLHRSLSGELLEVRKWNEMLADVTDTLGSSATKSSNQWTWSSLKKSFGGIFEGAKVDLAERLKNIKNIDVLELIPKFAEEKKPFLKNLFLSVTNFWKNTGTKSREFVEKALHEVNTDFSLSSMFSRHDETNVETEELPRESKTTDGVMSEENSNEKTSDFQEDLQKKVEHTTVSDGDGHSESVAENDNWNKFKEDWLFQRAANRENLRHTAQTKPINWYLRREQNLWRSPMTKEQMEILEKMEAARYPAFKKSHDESKKREL